MEEDDIERLFLSVSEGTENQSSKVKDVFAVLVRSTLQYRDDMLASKGIVITVEDVHMALECFVPFFETGQLPGTTDRIKLDLLRIWKDNLDKIV